MHIFILYYICWEFVQYKYYLSLQIDHIKGRINTFLYIENVTVNVEYINDRSTFQDRITVLLGGNLDIDDNYSRGILDKYRVILMFEFLSVIVSVIDLT